MKTIEESIELDVPVSKAYNQWTQFESFPQFMEGVERVEQKDDTRLHWVAKIGGESRSGTRRSPNSTRSTALPGRRSTRTVQMAS